MNSPFHQMNDPQKDAVSTLLGPLLILAGAGSGKTRVLTHRFANLILSGEAAPQEILAVTFTNKAAKEMGNRIQSLLQIPEERGTSSLWISTFHAFCVRVLRRHAELLGYKTGFVIYDDSDQLQTIKKCVSALNINDKIFPPKLFKARIHRAKMLGLTPAQASRTPGFAHDQKMLDVFARYEADLVAANAMDFEDLLLKTHHLLSQFPQVLKQYQEHFKFVMVDEYQDTNHVQYLLIKLLTETHRNLCVVGDEDQSIYSWRGADITNILNFEKDFPEAKVIKLEENYRSTSNIVRAASALIQKNTERKEKVLFTNNPPGDRILVREEKSEYEEARWVAKSIQNLMSNDNVSPEEIAVFYRTNAQSRVLEEQFRMLALPYRIFGGMRFYERQEIKDILCYFRLTINPTDDVAFRRVLNVPARGIGKTTLEKLDALTVERNCSLTSATQYALDNRFFNSGTNSKLRAFLMMMDDFREQADPLTLLELYQLILEKTEYLARLKSEGTLEAESRVENLRELGNALDQFTKERAEPSVASFLEEMSLSSDLDTEEAGSKAVTLMTLHLSKGLEYPYVFIVGVEENLFPSNRHEDSDQEEQGLEEERRLAYVGMTRARQKLHLTYARTRKVWGQDQYNPPSRFLSEIPSEFLESTTALEVSSSFRQRITQGFNGGSGSMNRPLSGDRNSRRGGGSDDFDTQDFPDYDQDFGAKPSLGLVKGFGASSSKLYSKGDRVRHPTFGVGTVYQLEGAGDTEKVSVIFQDHSVRKFITKFARLERI